jgi:hypothetical protein
MGEVQAGRNIVGYAPWSPRTKGLRLVGEVAEVLSDMRPYLPLTCRQIFYRMVAVYDYPKSENAYENLLYYLNRARRAGMINFDDIRDDGASRMASGHYADVDSFHGYVQRLGQRYTRDKLARQGVDIRVMCEAEGMMPQLARTCDRYSVPVYSCSGFDSLTYKYNLARAVHDNKVYEDKDTIVLHLGDLDPSGYSIYESMERDVEAFVKEDLGKSVSVIFHRVALDRDHVELHELPTYPPKNTDSRAKEWISRGLDTCQLEALPPEAVAQYLSEAIEMFMDADVLAEDREAEVRERREITRALPSGG